MTTRRECIDSLKLAYQELIDLNDDPELASISTFRALMYTKQAMTDLGVDMV